MIKLATVLCHSLPSHLSEEAFSLLLPASSASSTPKPESLSMNINTNGPSAPSSHLPSTLTTHNSTTLSSLAQDLPSVTQLSSLNRWGEGDSFEKVKVSNLLEATDCSSLASSFYWPLRVKIIFVLSKISAAAFRFYLYTRLYVGTIKRFFL